MIFQVFKGAIGFVRYVTHAHDLRKQFTCYFELHDSDSCRIVREMLKFVVFLIFGRLIPSVSITMADC